MRKVILALSLLQGFIVLSLAKPAPLSVKEISLMLRNGYSAEMIEKDLASRHFIETIDTAAEKSLAQSGATPALIAGLKSGAYAFPAQDLAAVQQEVDAKARRRATMEAESKKWNTLYQDQLARSRAAASTAAPSSPSGVAAAMLKGDLVTSKNGILSTFNDQALDQKKLFGLYFSARWCPSCRKFTPELVAYYNRIAASHPEFEIIFVSNDRSESAMEAYMRDAQMPWPAVKFEKIAEKEAVTRYAGSGIPCLVVIDAQGKVVSDSYEGKNYRGPQKVLADLDQLFGSGAPAAVAQSR